MSSTSPWSESALPAVLASLRSTAAAGPVDTSAVFDGGVAQGALLGRAVMRISGRDRIRFLHAMLSNDVAAMDRAGAGHGVRASLNSDKGRLVADVHLYLVDPDKKGGHVLALLEAEAVAPLVQMLDKYVIAEKVHFETLDDLAVFAVVGTGAGPALEALGATLPASAPHAHVETSVGGAAARVIRHELGGGADLLVVVDASGQDAVAAALGSLPRLSSTQLEALRIEAAIPRPGGDVTSLNIVLEGGLTARSVSFTKGCYIGQEVICRIDSLGSPAKLLVQLQGGDSVPAPGTELFAGGRVVGQVTSAVRSTRRGAPVLLGYVKKKSNDVGAEVQVGAADGPSVTITAHA